MTIDTGPLTSLQLQSEMTSGGTLELSLVEAPVPDPGDDELVVRIEAAPVNPTDIGLMFAAADLTTLTANGGKTVATVPPAVLPRFAGRLDRPLAVGSEGAGTVVRAGANAQALLGRRVAIFGPGTYAQYRVTRADACLVLPDGVTAAQGAAALINPLTALGMIETMRLDGHDALIHTAAASNLGQMLNRLCLAEGIPLINIVRSAAQAELLLGQGAVHICNSSDADFVAQLDAAVTATGVRLAFDAIGGEMPGRLLAAMEVAGVRRMADYSHYGSTEPKQVYVYGALDPGPIVTPRAMGMAWSISGWLLFQLVQRAGPDVFKRMRQRVADDLGTIFASSFDTTIGLADAIRPDVIHAYAQRATGRKFLLDPWR